MVDKRKKKKSPSSRQTVSTVRGRYVHHFSHSRVDEQGHLCSDIRGYSILDCGVADNQPGELPLPDSGSIPMRMAPINHAFLCMDETGTSVGLQMIQFPPLYLSNGDRTFSPASDCGNASDADHMPSSTRISSTNNVSSKSSIPDDVSYIDLGDCTYCCQGCDALFWYDERLKGSHYSHGPEYHLCCGGGDMYLPVTRAPPFVFQELLTNAHFMDHIRAYNQMFAMTSFGAKVDESVNKGRGPYVFKVSGQIYHWIGSLCPDEGEFPRFLQLYFYDTRDEITNRMRHFGGVNTGELSPEIVATLIQVLNDHNGLVHHFRTARDKCQGREIPGLKIRLYNKGGARGYEIRTADVLGGIVFEDGPKTRMDFDVIVEYRGGPPQRISKIHQSYMSLQFPLLFIYDEPGFYPELLSKPRGATGRGKKVSINAFYKYQLHPRLKSFGLLFKGGRLFQQYVVAVFCAIEQSRLDFIRKRQGNFRSDYLAGLYDAVSKGDREGVQAGSIILLPRTFTRGPRIIQQKVGDLISYLKCQRPFGRVIAFMYTIEFQKRGLPHCHTLVWVDTHDKIRDASDVDNYISAEIPSLIEDPNGYKVVTELMMHGPCGLANPLALCTDNGVCSKKFPKKFNDKTFFDANGHTHYRRRDTGPDRVMAKVGSSFGDADVQPGGKRVVIDEIQDYVDGRFICPFEACWRISDYPIHRREPAAQILTFRANF